MLFDANGGLEKLLNIIRPISLKNQITVILWTLLKIHLNSGGVNLAKKTNYQVGDIFKIDLENGLKGLGRILKINDNEFS